MAGWLLVVFACLAGLELYVAVAAMVILVPIFKAPRPSLNFLAALGIIILLKTITGRFVDLGPEYASYRMNDAAAAREYTAIALTGLLFVTGRHFLTREAIEVIPGGWLVTFSVANILIHAVSRGDVFSATADNTQIISFYLLYIVAIRKLDGAWPIVALLLAIFHAAGLQNSFSSAAAAMIMMLFITTRLNLTNRFGDYRSAVAVTILCFMFLSLVAYLFVFRINGEGNNGYTRAFLAQTAYRIFSEHPFTGTTIGLPVIPSSLIYMLGWMQYLDDQGDFNIYGLSFHNSLLYVLTRFGIFGYAAFFIFIVKNVPRRGLISDIAFTVIPFLFLSANVAFESARAGPGVALVLGSLFSFSWAKPPTLAKAEEN